MAQAAEEAATPQQQAGVQRPECRGIGVRACYAVRRTSSSF